MKKHSVGKAIANMRKGKGWTQVELAEKLGVSDKAVSKWESEAGMPDISQLPLLAEIFGVSIDYIMTGKMPDKKVVNMSKAQLCAKEDDVTLAGSVKNMPKDEHGKNIVDYIVKYKSVKVFKALCEKDPKFISRFGILDAVILATLSNSLSLLCGNTFQVNANCRFTFENEDEVKSLLPLEDMDAFSDYQYKSACIFPRSFFSLLVTNRKIGKETLNVFLSPQNGRKCVWYHAFPYLIEEAYKSGKAEMLQRLLNLTKSNNKIAYDTIKVPQNNYDNLYCLHYFFIGWQHSNEGHGLVRILESTIRMALEKGDFDLVKEFNDINSDVRSYLKAQFRGVGEEAGCYVASNDEIRVQKLKLDGSVSEPELQVQAAVHNGIISIDELKKTNDFKIIKKALYAYPIHFVELLYKWSQSADWKALYTFAIDHDQHRLADAAIRQDVRETESIVLNDWKNPDHVMKKLNINERELYITLKEFSCYGGIPRTQTNLQEIIDYLNKVRQRIIEELANKINKEKLVGELTKEYFYDELSKGNREMVIIKLCVRLEAVLKCDCRLEGDFSEMLENYCRDFNTTDDEGNDYDPDTPRMLDHLRKQRNSIVHSEKTALPMPDDELKRCIDYICAL